MTENGHISISLQALPQDGSDTNELSAMEDSEDCGSQTNVELNCMEDEIDSNLSFFDTMLEVKRTVFNRLDDLENQLNNINHYSLMLEERLDSLISCIQSNQDESDLKKQNQTVIVGMPGSLRGTTVDGLKSPYFPRLGPNVTLINLNSEADYPNGSWLGDESNPEMRVRCRIPPTDLLHIITTCHTAEKMALTLLDYLFDRDTQACSNISGTGKHKKKQLDPLMIYGIRCHLIHKFGVTEKDWHRIKLNLDSKCRTAFRRRMKEVQPENSNSDVDTVEQNQMQSVEEDETNGLALQEATIKLVDSSELNAVIQGAQVLHTTDGEIQVLHATPEQIAQMQQTHQIQILTGDHVLQTADGHVLQEISEATEVISI